MPDHKKGAMEMSRDEYKQARAAVIRHRPALGLSAAERADLAERRANPPTTPKDAREMTAAEFKAAKAKAIRKSYP
jgi:hypothetical protein